MLEDLKKEYWEEEFDKRFSTLGVEVSDMKPILLDLVKKEELKTFIKNLIEDIVKRTKEDIDLNRNYLLINLSPEQLEELSRLIANKFNSYNHK